MSHEQKVLDHFKRDDPFRIQHAALRTREQMIHTLVSYMYGDYSQENAEEVMTALVSLRTLFGDCLELVEEMIPALDAVCERLRMSLKVSRVSEELKDVGD